MSIPTQQHKLKPQPVAQKKAECELEEARLAHQKLKLREEPPAMLEFEGPELSEPALTVEAKLVEQLEACASALLSLISIGTPESELPDPTSRSPLLNSYTRNKLPQTCVITPEQPKPLLNVLKTFTVK